MGQNSSFFQNKDMEYVGYISTNNINNTFGLFTTHSFTNSSEVESPAIFHLWSENRVWMVCEDSYEVGFPFSQYVFEFKE